MKNPLQKHFDQLDNYLKKGDLVADNVSKKGIYWHVDHCVRILEGIPDAMRASKKEDYQHKSNLSKLIILNTGWIPRGKGRSPKHVLPDENQLDADTIHKRADRAWHQVNSVSSLPESAHFRHPLFGSLKRDKAVKFMKIHTNHHLKIMRDIVKENNL